MHYKNVQILYRFHTVVQMSTHETQTEISVCGMFLKRYALFDVP